MLPSAKERLVLPICMIITGLGVHRPMRFDDFGVITGVRKEKCFYVLVICRLNVVWLINIKTNKNPLCDSGMCSREIINILFTVSIFYCLSFKYYCSSCFYVREVFKTA